MGTTLRTATAAQLPNTQDINMYTALVLLLVGAAFGEQFSQESVETLQDERVAPHDNGAHNMHLKLSNGVEMHLGGEDGNMIGIYGHIMEDGSVATLKFVADEGGFQPESSILPVALAFPHPIPKFVMDQIEFAERQRALRAQYSSEEE